jgi:DNA-binding PadR family transcriptional regulator
VTDLSKSAYVVLGMIATGRRSGYQMSRTAKHATRFFWATSDGQIYPQLKKLADAGLITGEREADGGRERIVYSLTDEGRAALHEWLTTPARPVVELRDEGLLRLFFADELSVGELRAQLALMRLRHERGLEQLEEIERTEKEPRRACAMLTLRYGVDLQRWAIAWYDDLLAELADRDGDERAADALRALEVVPVGSGDSA